MIAQACVQAGGFWMSDDRMIAIFGALVMVFFIGLWIGESRAKG